MLTLLTQILCLIGAVAVVIEFLMDPLADPPALPWERERPPRAATPSKRKPPPDVVYFR